MADVMAAAAIWLLLFAAAVVITAFRVRPAPGPPAGPDGSPPALLNLCVTQGRLDGAAYAATILDLAARGRLVLTEPRAGHLCCALPRAPVPAPGLAGFEGLVLGAVTGRLAADGPAPFEALAARCTADVPGTWDPFERAVRGAGRQRGLTRPRLPAAAAAPLYAGAATLGLLVFLAAAARPHTGLWVALATSFFPFVLPAYWTRSVARQDRLTRSGAALAAWAVTVAAPGPAGWPGGISGDGPGPAQAAARLAAAVAVHAAGPAAVHAAGLGAWATPPGRTGVRVGGRRAAARGGMSGLFVATDRPRAAWSSRSGEWRRVEVPAPGLPLRYHPGALLAAALWAALLCYPASLLPGVAGVLVLAVLAAVAITAGAAAALALVRWLAKPAEVIFDGQVIARWVELGGSGDDNVYIPCFAVDDGQRAWSVQASRGRFADLSVGQSVRVQASPRSRKLLGLVPSGPVHAAPPVAEDAVVPDAGPGAAGVTTPAARTLVTPDEAARILGGPVRETWLSPPAGSGVIYRGDGGTVSVTVAEGLPGRVSAAPARRAGRRLAGIGDEAWLLNRDRTAVVCAAGLTAKITVSGQRELDHAGVLSGLAAAVAARLAEQVRRP
jgi:hypothetical protein